MQNIENTHSQWRLLYLVAGIAAFASIILIPIQTAFFIIWPLPTDVETWFAVFADNPIRGLIGLDLLLMVQIILVGLVYLGLAVVLWPANKSAILMAMALGFLGLALYFPSNTSFEMLHLSGQYTATTDVEIGKQLLGAGRGALATFIGTAFNAYYVLNAAVLLLFAYSMYGSAYFTRMTAHIGVMTGALMIVPATVGIVGMTMAFLSLIPWMIYCFILGRVFLRMK